MPVEGRGLGSGLTQYVVRDRRLGNLSTPKSVQKLQMALHAKAKTEAGYRFYALYDKIYRGDILAHAYAQCCSNKGAPGVDGQDFPDIEAYGVKRWLGELATALKEETYRPDPIRRVFIPKPNGKLRPLGISTLRDRVCMTAAMLVLDPIFEADLPPEQYAYRAGRNAQQAVIDAEETLYQGHLDVGDADPADYLDESSHYTSGYCGWIKKVWKSRRYLYSDAFCTATVDMNCLQLAALYTLQDGLARDAEQIHGLEHFHVPVGRIFNKHRTQFLRHTDAPRSAWRDLLARNEAIVEPTMQGRGCEAERLRGTLHRHALSLTGFFGGFKTRYFPACTQTGDATDGEGKTRDRFSSLSIENAGDDGVRIKCGET